MKFRIAVLATAALALTACEAQEDGPIEDPEVDNVETTADDAMQPVTEEPVADPAANADPVVKDTGAPATATIEEAGDNAAATAEAAMDAMAKESQ